MADLLFPFVALIITVTTQHLNIAKLRKDHLRLVLCIYVLNAKVLRD